MIDPSNVVRASPLGPTRISVLLRSASSLAAFGVGLLGSTPAPAGAQVQPMGGEFQVNTLTSSWQYHPRLTSAPDGSFVVVWLDHDGSSSLRGQRFDAVGAPLGGELPMDQQTALVVGAPELGTAGNGDFVMVWGQGGPGCPGCWDDYIKGRRFDATASPVEDQFAVSEPPGDEYTGDGSVAVHADGSFVVVWNQGYDPYARRYAADGSPSGAAFPLPEGAGTAAYTADALAFSDGSSLLGWTERDGSLYSLVAQSYDPAGAPTGTPRTLVDPSDDWFDSEWSASSAGEVVVVHGDASGGVVGRRFDASGDPLGPAFPVTGEPSVEVGDPSVHHGPSGEFVVTWQSAGSQGGDSDGSSVQARRFAPDGTPLGSQFQVNTYTTGNQTEPRAATLASGDLVVVWASAGSFGSDTDGLSIQARLFQVPFFMDGFENGTTSRWSASVELAR